MTTTPSNPFFLMLFLVAVGGMVSSLLRAMKFSYIISFVITAAIEALLLLRIFQMAGLLNIVLVVAISVCFISFAKNMN